ASSGEIDLSNSTPGSYTVTYAFNNGVCGDVTKTQVVIYDLPVVSFNGVLPTVCVQATPFTLTIGNPAGGVYRGLGIKGDSMYPISAGVGTHIVEYTYTNPKGCAATITTSITITPFVAGNTPLSFPEVCVNANSFTLMVSSGIPVGGQFNGKGVNGTIFDPQQAGVGKHIIQYITPAVSGCAAIYSGTIQVNPKPDIQVNAVNKVCEGTAVIINPIANGTLFWADSSGKLNQLSSSLIIKATRNTTYFITCRDGKGCTNTQPVAIEVDPVPDAKFSFNSNTFCGTGSVTALIGGMSGGTFSANPGLQIDSVSGKIDLQNSIPGSYQIIYQVNNTTGCSAAYQQSITVDPVPQLSIAKLSMCIGTVQAISATGMAIGGAWNSSNTLIAEVDNKGLVKGNMPGQTLIRYTNVQGCSSGLAVIVKELPRLSGKPIVCKKDSIQIFTNAGALGNTTQFISQAPSIATVDARGVVKGERSGIATIEFRDAIGCVATHIVQVDSVPVRSLAPALACEPATIRLDQTMLAAYGNTGYTYTYWKDSTGKNLLNNPLRVAESGSYFIHVQNANGCKSEKPARVEVAIARAIAAKRLDTIKTQNNVPVQLNARTIGKEYRWTPSVGLNSSTIRDPWFSYLKNMEYQVSFRTDSGCLVTDTVFVKAVDANIYVPSAFTPNADGKNDKFAPVCYSISRINFFSVFNRWGELVYTTNAIGKGWDGTFKSGPAEPGTYVWMVEAVGMDGQVYRQKGTVVLIR
ncbi:MAG: gliding motility-associated C-terminal domain-containing protein, partial [Sediminibacterium sp.]|nr:gliding motility-associated C-terminal domain-containing protein [Sediminibacterium sp.]